MTVLARVLRHSTLACESAHQAPVPLGQTEGSSHSRGQPHALAALRVRGADIIFARRLLSGAYRSGCLTHEGQPASYFEQRVCRRAHRSAHEDRSALLPLREPGVRPSHPPLVENNIHSSPTQRYCGVLVRCVRNGTGLESRRAECLLVAPKPGGCGNRISYWQEPWRVSYAQSSTGPRTRRGRSRAGRGSCEQSATTSPPQPP